MAGEPERLVAMVREHTVPIITGAPGFRCHFTCFDEAVPRLGIGVTLFDRREYAESASERVVAAMREKGIEAKSPKMFSGRVRILATADAW